MGCPADGRQSLSRFPDDSPIHRKGLQQELRRDLRHHPPTGADLRAPQRSSLPDAPAPPGNGGGVHHLRRPRAAQLVRVERPASFRLERVDPAETGLGRDALVARAGSGASGHKGGGRSVRSHRAFHHRSGRPRCPGSRRPALLESGGCPVRKGRVHDLAHGSGRCSAGPGGGAARRRSILDVRRRGHPAPRLRLGQARSGRSWGGGDRSVRLLHRHRPLGTAARATCCRR